MPTLDNVSNNRANATPLHQSEIFISDSELNTALAKDFMQYKETRRANNSLKAMGDSMVSQKYTHKSKAAQVFDGIVARENKALSLSDAELNKNQLNHISTEIEHLVKEQTKGANAYKKDLKCNFDINQTTPGGQTILHLYADQGDRAMCDFIINQKFNGKYIDIAKQDKLGNTAAHTALDNYLISANKSCLTIASNLMKLNPKICMIKNNRGANLFEYAGIIKDPVFYESCVTAFTDTEHATHYTDQALAAPVAEKPQKIFNTPDDSSSCCSKSSARQHNLQMVSENTVKPKSNDANSLFDSFKDSLLDDNINFEKLKNEAEDVRFQSLLTPNTVKKYGLSIGNLICSCIDDFECDPKNIEMVLRSTTHPQEQKQIIEKIMLRFFGSYFGFSHKSIVLEPSFNIQPTEHFNEFLIVLSILKSKSIGATKESFYKLDGNIVKINHNFILEFVRSIYK